VLSPVNHPLIKLPPLWGQELSPHILPLQRLAGQNDRGSIHFLRQVKPEGTIAVLNQQW
jgi:hypothetical protein